MHSPAHPEDRIVVEHYQHNVGNQTTPAVQYYHAHGTIAMVGEAPPLEAGHTGQSHVRGSGDDNGKVPGGSGDWGQQAGEGEGDMIDHVGAPANCNITYGNTAMNIDYQDTDNGGQSSYDDHDGQNGTTKLGPRPRRHNRDKMLRFSQGRRAVPPRKLSITEDRHSSPSKIKKRDIQNGVGEATASTSSHDTRRHGSSAGGSWGERDRDNNDQSTPQEGDDRHQSTHHNGRDGEVDTDKSLYSRKCLHGCLVPAPERDWETLQSEKSALTQKLNAMNAERVAIKQYIDATHAHNNELKQHAGDLEIDKRNLRCWLDGAKLEAEKLAESNKRLKRRNHAMQCAEDERDAVFGRQEVDQNVKNAVEDLFQKIAYWTTTMFGSNSEEQMKMEDVDEKTHGQMIRAVVPGLRHLEDLPEFLSGSASKRRRAKIRRKFARAVVTYVVVGSMFRNSPRVAAATPQDKKQGQKQVGDQEQEPEEVRGMGQDLWVKGEIRDGLRNLEDLLASACPSNIPLASFHEWRALTMTLLSRVWDGGDTMEEDMLKEMRDRAGTAVRLLQSLSNHGTGKELFECQESLIPASGRLV
ncbi:uncharacterized protein MKZ38_002660 [Zalerion maritima]|uniref:Uncharacterized protein n=1 Tax=Zalerion maritima TaxID=339359 RepID=A0AAD5WSV6_9PEZI|nr:uncharacterized protein MKZ38_002660 [Zalerion maritima]